MIQEINFLMKKYLTNNLKTLAKIYNLTQVKEFVYYHEIEEYLNRGRNQVSTLLSKLEDDKLIMREKNHRPQKIYLTSLGKQLVESIIQVITK